ncbi:MAG: recombinase family protein [Clostridia bacterium]|nr:recombinase family protein [Clostridia bacterium]
MTGIAYVRSALKNDAYIASQTEQIKKKAAIENIELADIIVKNGVNGIRSKQDLKKFLNEIKKTESDVIIVADITRITRNMRLLLELQDNLQKENISILVSTGEVNYEGIKSYLQHFGCSR